MKQFFLSVKAKISTKAGKVMALLGIGGSVAALTATTSFASPPPVTVSMTGLSPVFSTSDLITGAEAFLGPYAPFILLAGALIFAPVLVMFILWVVKQTRKGMAGKA